MIRKSKKSDTDRIADIWLDTNIRAHDFIPADYWKSNFVSVKEMLSEAEIYVYEDEIQNKILGFIGLDGDHIAGIFVSHVSQSKGIGSSLLNFVKNTRERLTLNVYKKNSQASEFYLKENFKISHEGIDENTGEQEYSMIWKQDLPL